MCVVIWAVSLGQNGAVDIFLAYFVDRLDCMNGVNIGGYTLGQHHHHVVQPPVRVVLAAACIDIPPIGTSQHRHTQYIKPWVISDR